MIATGLAPSTSLAAPTCHGFTVTPINFGVYNPLSSTPLDSVGSISYNCPKPIGPPQVTISTGNSGTFFNRGMSTAGDPVLLQYNLYVDAARSTVWGDGNSGTDAPIVPNGGSTLQVYGRVFPLQDVAVGTFTDTVIVTFNF